MTEIFNGQSPNQTPSVPGMTREQLMRALAARDARDQETLRHVEILDQLLGNAKVPGALYDNPAPAMPQYSPVPPMYNFVPPAETFVAPPEATPVVHREMTVDETYYRFAGNIDNAEREKFIADKQAQGNDVKYTYVSPDQDFTTFKGGDQEELNRRLKSEESTAAAVPTKPKKNISSVPYFDPDHSVNRHLGSANKATEQQGAIKPKKEKTPFLTKRVKAIGAGVLGLSVVAGGGVLAIQNFTGGSHDAAIVDEKNVPNVDPELIPALTAAPLIEAFGGCIDENGGGPVLGSATVTTETGTSWKTGITGPNGGELTLETIDPVTRIKSGSKVQLESAADYTACVVAANVANVVSVDITNPEAPVATVSLPDVDPQIRGRVTNILDRGWSSAEFETPLIKVEDVVASGVEAKKIPADVAASFTAAYNDVPNAAAEVQAAENATIDTLATEGSVYSEQLKAVIKQKISTAIKDKVKQLAQDGLTTAKSITVNWTGALKGLLAKKQPVPAANKITVETKSSVNFVANATAAPVNEPAK
jgi:hypothetical protein